MFQSQMKKEEKNSESVKTAEISAENKDGSKENFYKRFVMTNTNGMEVHLINYGAAITVLKVPNHLGEKFDVVLGFDDIKCYLGECYGGNPYCGASIGRVANRIGKGTFTLNGQKIKVSINNGENHLHGGIRGFDKRIWEATLNNNRVIFSRVSSDGEEGYPGDLLAQVTYELTQENELVINYQATTSKTTPVNMTNHSHFNLGGHEKSVEKLVGHTVEINADNYTPVNDSLIPTGEIKSVVGTEFDIRSPKDLNVLLLQFPPGPYGYDHNFCINQNDEAQLNFVARVRSDISNITMEVYSDQPGVQFYTGNFFPDPQNGEEGIVGKGGAKYVKHGSFALETQKYPDSVNNPQFPSTILVPGDVYRQTCVYKFLSNNRI